MSNSNPIVPLNRPVPLPLEFKHKSFGYRQLERNDKAAIYSQSAGDQIAAYEVVKICVVQPEIVMGKEYPLREVYPPDSQWGSKAWTCTTLGEARAKMKFITEIQPKSLGVEHTLTGEPFLA